MNFTCTTATGVASWWLANQHILNKPKASHCKRLKCHDIWGQMPYFGIFGEKLPSQPRTLVLFYPTFAMSCIATITKLTLLNMLNKGRWEREEMACRGVKTCWTRFYSSCKRGEVLQTTAKKMAAKAPVGISVTGVRSAYSTGVMLLFLPPNMTLFWLRWGQTCMLVSDSKYDLNRVNIRILLCM